MFIGILGVPVFGMREIFLSSLILFYYEDIYVANFYR